MVVVLSSSWLLSSLIEELDSLICISYSFYAVEVKNVLWTKQSDEQRTTSSPKVLSFISSFLSIVVLLSIVMVALSAIIKSAKLLKVCKLLSSAELLNSIESRKFRFALFST